MICSFKNVRIAVHLLKDGWTLHKLQYSGMFTAREIAVAVDCERFS